MILSGTINILIAELIKNVSLMDENDIALKVRTLNENQSLSKEFRDEDLDKNMITKTGNHNFMFHNLFID